MTTEASLAETPCIDGPASPYTAFVSLPKSGMIDGLSSCSLFQSDLMDGMDKVSDTVTRAEGSCNAAWSILRDCEKSFAAQDASDAGRRTRLVQVARILEAGQVREKDWEAATQHVCKVTGISSNVACHYLYRSRWRIDVALAAIAAASVSGKTLCASGGEVVLHFKIADNKTTPRRFQLVQSAFDVHVEAASLLNKQRGGQLICRVCGAGLEISLGVEKFGRTLKHLGLRVDQRYEVEVDLPRSSPETPAATKEQEPEVAAMAKCSSIPTEELGSVWGRR